jgi:hypothetical protein
MDKKTVNNGKHDFFLVPWRANARASGGTGISIFLSLGFSFIGSTIFYLHIYILLKVERQGKRPSGLERAGLALLDV